MVMGQSKDHILQKDRLLKTQWLGLKLAQFRDGQIQEICLCSSSVVIWLLVCDDLAAAEGCRRLSTAQQDSKIRNDSASLTHDFGGVFTIERFQQGAQI